MSGRRTKIKSETILFDRASGGVEFVRVTSVDRSGLFYTNLPSEVAEGLDCDKEITGKTLDEVNREFDKRLEEFKGSNQTKRKVIVYAFKYEDGFEHRSSTGISFADGIGIMLYAVAMEEIETKKPGGQPSSFSYSVDRSSPLFERYGYPKGVGHGGRKIENTIEWTQEREDFFMRMGEAIVSLIEKIKAVTASPDVLVSFIACGVPLLSVKKD